MKRGAGPPLPFSVSEGCHPRVRSVFHPTEITFLPYSMTEVREILADRVRQGLYPQVISKVLLDRIASIAAGGSPRTT